MESVLNSQTVRLCPRCQTPKPLSAFPKNIKTRPHCKECRNSYERARYTTLQDRARQLRYRYGITLEDYDAMYAAQGGRCAICDTTKPLLDVDHDHETGEVRKLLCRGCNVLLGKIENSPALVQKILLYLDEHGHGK